MLFFDVLVITVASSVGEVREIDQKRRGYLLAGAVSPERLY